MQSTSATYKSIISGPYSCRVKLDIYDAEDTLVGSWGMDKLISMTTAQAMIKDDTKLIGNCIAGSINVSFYPTDSNGDLVEIPRMAKLIPSVQVYNDEDDSEWVQKGEFFIDTRAYAAVTNVLELNGYDAMLKAEMDYPSDDVSEYPKDDIDIVELIATAMGVTVDERTESIITSAYQISLPIGYSCREVLSAIATMYGANFVITDTGELRAISLDEVRDSICYLVEENNAVILIGGVAINVWSPAITVGRDLMGLDSSPAYDPVSKVLIMETDDTYIEAGDDTGATMECYCPFAGDEDTGFTASDLLGRVSGFTYQPFDATGVFLDPAAEVGDGIEVAGVVSGIFNMTTTFSTLFTANIDAPTTREIDHEYPYEPQADRQYERRMAAIGSRITQTADKISQEITDRTNADRLLSSSITQTVNQYLIELGLGDMSVWFSFTANGLEIGKTGSPFSVVISESELGFYENGTRVAYANNNQFFMPYGVVQNKLDVGGYQLDATDGIKFRWKGRDN